MGVLYIYIGLTETNLSFHLIPVEDQQPDKAEQAPAPVKKEAPIVTETKVLDGATPSATSGKKKNSAKKLKTESGNEYQTLFLHAGQRLRLKPSFLSNTVDEFHILADTTASANHQAPHNDDVSSKGSGKKQRNETNKGRGNSNV